MIENKTVIERIEILAGGSIQVRFAKLIVDGDKLVGVPQWHRVALDPGADVGAILIAINNHLDQMGEARCEDNETPFSILTPQFLKDQALIVHTPERVARYRMELERAAAALRPPVTPSP